CGEHSAVVPTETYTNLPTMDARLREVARLQRQAAERLRVGDTRAWLAADEIIGQPISRLVPPDRPDDVMNILRTIRCGERVEHYETERVRKDGERIWVSLTVSPIKDSNGRVVGASKIARDITERVRAERTRGWLSAIVESSDDAIVS